MMMNEKKQRVTVLIGVLLLTGLFALGYIGINRFVFATADTNATLDQPLTTLFDAINDEHFTPLQDDYLTEQEAKVIFAETLADRAGLEFDLSDLHMVLFDEPPNLISTWQGVTWGSDRSNEFHNFAIKLDAITGSLLEFGSDISPMGEHTVINMTISEPHEMTFDIKQYTPIIPRYWDGEIRSYHLTIEEAAKVMAEAMYEEYDIILDGHTLIIDFKDDSFNENASWDGFVTIEDRVSLAAYDDIDYDGFGAYSISITVNALTGEVISLRKNLSLG